MSSEAAVNGTGAPVLFKNGIVLTMDKNHSVLAKADVLVRGDTIAAIGPDLETPEHAQVIDASGGMITRASSTPTVTCGRPPCAAMARTGP